MQEDITSLLAASADGDPDAIARVAAIVHDELRDLASRILAHERPGQTLRTTALVNEAYAKLAVAGASYEGRGHFLNTAARAMRQILVDYARTRSALKRGGGKRPLPLDDVVDRLETDRVDLIALDEALTRLEAIDARKARVVELRYFAGLTIDDTADALGVSHTTVENDWRFARSWLHREIAQEPDA